jgi:sugar (pentulose or hexulose) kinase
LTYAVKNKQIQPWEDAGMRNGCVVVLDVGKTLSKLTIWSPERELIERRTHRNSRAVGSGYPALDVKGIGFWLAQTLAAYSRLGEITAIIPVGHGAAACLVNDDGSFLPSLDYEAEPPTEIKERYLKIRDPFAVTGSPGLPFSLNLGVQLLWLEAVAPEKFRRARIVTWPQFWAWRLCGVAATEVTSLGCHTDLWVPAERRPSPMAVAQGWDKQLAPLRHAGDILGCVTQEWSDRCGLPKDCEVICGLHDSNAALLATRGYPEIDGRECTVLSTGTWFVAMRSAATDAKIDLSSIPEARDCLINVDVSGRPVPSARFMGGRDVELLEVATGAQVDIANCGDALVNIAQTMVKNNVFAIPTFENGVGPFPKSVGRWVQRPSDQIGRRAVAGLYLALMANTCLDMIDSRETLVVEGRFATDAVFTRALAALRPSQKVFLSDVNNSLPYGALRLVDTGLAPSHVLTRVEPLPGDMTGHAALWRSTAQSDLTEA